MNLPIANEKNCKRFNYDTSFRRQLIEALSKEMWEKGGMFKGADQFFWLEAEKQLLSHFAAYINEYTIAWNRNSELAIIPIFSYNLNGQYISETYKEVCLNRKCVILLLDFPLFKLAKQNGHFGNWHVYDGKVGTSDYSVAKQILQEIRNEFGNRKC